jgi:hypothetical protein
MNTFLPLPSFAMSLHCLDDRRLGKQRVEAKQILDILTDKQDSNWRNHPCVKMWAGYEDALSNYLRFAIHIWIYRGKNNTIKMPDFIIDAKKPWWLGFDPVHVSHRANLIRKDPIYYGRYGWKEEPYSGYYWPCKVIGEKTRADKYYWFNYCLELRDRNM